MRLVPVNSIKEGTLLAQTIYNESGVPLLRAGYPLNEKLIGKAIYNGFSSLYIDDSYSDEIIADIIGPELRQKAVFKLKSCFKGMQKMVSKNSKALNSKMNEHINDISNLANEIVDRILMNKDIFVNLVDIKNMDDYTYQHSVNTAVLAIVLGVELGFSKKQMQSLAVGALLHDFGKVFISKDILLKPSHLSDHEFNQIKDHPLLGYAYFTKQHNLDSIALSIILGHHEKVNGTGYPNKLSGVNISLYAKMVAICDIYDAVTSDRAYRKAMEVSEAIELIMGSCGIDLDLDLVKAFLKRIVPYQVGTLVRLSNHEVAVVKNINPPYVLRPVVELIDRGYSTIELDLLTETNIVIEGVCKDIPG